jgi:hypothetical protein
MPARPQFTGSIWFVSIVALVVALGTQLLLESILPVAGFNWLDNASSNPAPHYRIADASIWREDSILRLVAFAFGGAVACLLAWSRSKNLVASLVAVSLLATVFTQFPGRSATWQLVIWALSGPVGALLAGWAFARSEADA